MNDKKYPASQIWLILSTGLVIVALVCWLIFHQAVLAAGIFVIAVLFSIVGNFESRREQRNKHQE